MQLFLSPDFNIRSLRKKPKSAAQKIKELKEKLHKSDCAKVAILARRGLSLFVYDAVQLEGINFTLPDIQTLLEGIAVGGSRFLMSKSQSINVMHGASFWPISIKTNLCFRRLTHSNYMPSPKKEALAWGCFRSGGVTIAGADYMPPAHTQLNDLFAQLVDEQVQIGDIYDRAIWAFLTMARQQFFMM